MIHTIHPIRLTSLHALLAVVAILTATTISFAGPLAPPPGPVAPTLKTLSEVEPRTVVNATNTPGNAFALFRITQRGSYYLQSNIVVPAGVVWAISIEAQGATLDLNGFTIDGATRQVGGIIASAAGITIRNGTITQTALSGISTDSFPTGAPGLTLENIRVFDVSGSGIPAGGSPGAGVAGIFAGRGAIIRNCYVNNAALGIAAGFNANISDCTVEFARQFAFHIQGGSQISNCIAIGTSAGPTNDGHGFFLGTGSLASNCVARSNAGTGFITDTECLLSNCTATNNSGSGFNIADRSRISRSFAASNAVSGAIVKGSFCQVIDSSFKSNVESGITLNTASHTQISNNTINGFNIAFGAGIRVTNTCNDITIANNVVGFALRTIELDGSYTRVTNNSFHQTSGAVTNSSGTAPNATNMVAPIILPANISTATNPFANTQL